MRIENNYNDCSTEINNNAMETISSNKQPYASNMHANKQLVYSENWPLY